MVQTLYPTTGIVQCPVVLRRRTVRGILTLIVTLIVMRFSGVADAQLMDSAWAKFSQNLQNTGQSPYSPSSNSSLSLKCSYLTSNFLDGGVAVGSDGTLYIQSYDNGYPLYALNPNCSLKWSYNIGDNTESTPALSSDGIIYISAGTDPTGDGLYAIYPNGSLKWKYEMRAGYSSSPTIDSDGIIYVGSHDGYLYAVNPNGTLRWNVYVAGVIDDSSPAIDSNNIIYIGGINSANLSAIYPNGTFKWNYTIDGAVNVAPSIDSNGIVYIASSSGNNLYAIYPNGTLKWTYPVNTKSIGISISLDGTIYFSSSDSNIYAIYPNGSLKWNFSIIATSRSVPAIDSNSVIYVGSGINDKNFYAIYPNGTLKWNYTTGSGIAGSPSIGSDGTIYVLGWDHKFYAFAPAPSTTTISCPAVSWCYLTQNYTSKTMSELDNFFSTDTIQGHYNITSQKYESHRTGYSFNQNVSVMQKEGYYYYFTSATDVIAAPGTTPSITLKTGWNLIGNYGSSARTLSALKSSIGVSATQAQYYNKTLKTWTSSNSQNVPAMESFFVYVTANTNWSG